MKPDGWKQKMFRLMPVFLTLALPILALAEESDYGYVSVTTDAQNATLYVDGAYIGKLPMLDSIKLPVGKHLLSFLPGSRTSKLYPIGDDVPTTITTTKETEVEYPPFHVHVTFTGGASSTDSEDNKDEDKTYEGEVAPTDNGDDNNKTNDGVVSPTDRPEDQDKDKDKDGDKDKDRDRDKEKDKDKDHNRGRDHDRDHDRDHYYPGYWGPDKTVTTITSTTGPNVSYNERRVIESASYWVYVQSEGTTPIFMDYSKYQATIDLIKEEGRRRNACFWGGIGAGAALVTAVIVIAMFQ